MAYAVKVTPAARRSLRRLSREVQERIVVAIALLAESPRPPSARKLQGATNFYRIRVGDYRVIYDIEDDALRILMIRIGHRRDIYRQ